MQQQARTIEELKTNVAEITNQATRLFGDYTQLKTGKSKEVAELEKTVADIECRYGVLDSQLIELQDWKDKEKIKTSKLTQ